jgi:hypothetical protein
MTSQHVNHHDQANGQPESSAPGSAQPTVSNRSTKAQGKQPESNQDNQYQADHGQHLVEEQQSNAPDLVTKCQELEQENKQLRDVLHKHGLFAGIQSRANRKSQANDADAAARPNQQ